MLSYVLPVEEKPPPIVNKSHLQLNLDIEKSHKEEEMAPTTIQNFISIEQAQGTFPGERGIRKIMKTHAAPTISTESSASSLSSKASEGGATPTGGEKLKPKLANGATKTTSLKRVSFGSSKGSMVETLIYESPLQEESELVTPVVEITPPFPQEGDTSGSDSKKVRVTFFESERPHVVHSPEPGDVIFDILDAPNVMTSVSPTGIHTPQYQRQARKCSDDFSRRKGDNLRVLKGGTGDELIGLRQNARMATMATTTTSHGGFLYYVVKVPKDGESGRTDSGWDNPFRPDGDLSREADEIVGLIKEGKPITPTAGNGALKTVDEPDAVAALHSKVLAASPQKGSNGTAPVQKGGGEKGGVVEVQRTVVAPSGGGDVEPVVIKKKPKCKCCVIQ